LRPTILIIATFISVAAANVALAQASGNATLAKRIIELAKTGGRNPDLLCEHALTSFQSRKNM
jgi:hypothetical protein